MCHVSLTTYQSSLLNTSNLLGGRFILVTYASVTFAPGAGREVGIGRRFGLPGAGDFHRCLRISYSIFIVYCSHIYTDYQKGARPMLFFDKISRQSRAPYGRRQIIGQYLQFCRHRKGAGNFYHKRYSYRCPYDFFLPKLIGNYPAVSRECPARIS